MDQQTAETLLRLAEDFAPAYRGSRFKSALAQLEQRHDDMLSAIQWFIDHSCFTEALQLASLLASYWTATKQLAVGRMWFDRVLAVPGGDDSRRGRALFDAGLMAFWLGDDEKATMFHEGSLEIGRRIGDATVTALALSGLARIALRTTGTGEAKRLCREAVSVTDGTADRVGRSSAIHVLAVVAQMDGDMSEARKLMGERIAIGRELGNLSIVGLESGNLSMVERQLGNMERAEALARTALEIYAEREDEWAIPFGLSGIAAIATHRGDHQQAATLIGAAEALMQLQGAHWPPDEKVHYEKTVAALSDAMGAQECERVRAVGRSMTWQAAVHMALKMNTTAS